MSLPELVVALALFAIAAIALMLFVHWLWVTCIADVLFGTRRFWRDADRRFRERWTDDDDEEDT